MRRFEVFVAYSGDTPDEHLIIEAEKESDVYCEAMAWVCPWDIATEIKVTRELINHKWVPVQGGERDD